MRNEWIEHRRGIDGERLGWMRPVGDNFVAVDLLGRDITEPVDWLVAEETLDDLGIGYLADIYELQVDTGWLRVRLVEVTATEIRVKKDDYGDMTAEQVYYTVANPMPEGLRARGTKNSPAGA